MRHRHSNEDPVKLFSIAALAAVIGAGVAMLFTPRNGSQVRSGLKRRAEHLKDEMHDKFDRTTDEAQNVAEDAKDRMQETVDKAVNDARATAAKVKDDAKATKDDAKSAASEAKKPRRNAQ